MTSLVEAIPGIEGHWAQANGSLPGDLSRRSDKDPVFVVCDDCGEVFESTPYRLQGRKYPFLCRDCVRKRSNPLAAGRPCVPVVCFDTGERFESVKEAAGWLSGKSGKALGSCRNMIGRSCRKGEIAFGYRFAYVDREYAAKMLARELRKSRGRRS